MMRLFLLCGVLAACSSPAKPATTTPTGSDTAATGEPTCSLDDANSCPAGQSCVVAEGAPTRTGSCKAAASQSGPGKACNLDDANPCPAGQSCKVPDGLPTRSGTCG